jgi:hypothetical protein
MPTATERAADRTILVRSFEILSVFDRMSHTRGFGSRCSISTTFGLTFKTCPFLENIWHVARPAGLEPATLGLEGRCSIH